jgi:REP element-mobilizing transposase RayT
MKRRKLRVYVHFVWATWDRLPLIEEELERDLYRYIAAVCREKGCEALALGGMPDHLHLLVQLSNTVSLSELMQHVKGGSSRLLTEKRGNFAWQGGYGAFSVSPRHKERVIAYIHNQKRHHAEQTLWLEAEECLESVS